MPEPLILKYTINDPIELNLSYIPFLNEGGLFIPTMDTFFLGDLVLIDLLLPGKKDPLKIEGKVVWITPQNALHHVLPGIGVEFAGANGKANRAQIEALLDKSMEMGGYTYGMTQEAKK